MYVEYDIPHIYFLSDIFIVFKPTTMAAMTLKSYCLLVWRDLLIFLIIHISPSVSQAGKMAEVALNVHVFIYSNPMKCIAVPMVLPANSIRLPIATYLRRSNFSSSS